MRSVRLDASERRPPRASLAAETIDSEQRIAVTVYLKRRSPDTFATGSAQDFARLLKPVSQRALAAQRRKTHARAAARVVKFAALHGLDVTAIDLASRAVTVEGSVRKLTTAFGATLRLYQDDNGTFRARTGSLSVTSDIAPWVRAVLGFDQRPQAGPQRGQPLQSLAGIAAGPGLWPSEIAALYGIPLVADASSVCVGLVALGGGYLATDIAQALGGQTRPSPVIVEQSIDGMVNSYGNGTRSDQELALDLQVLAALLPRARIVVYFADNTTQSLVKALNTAVFDRANQPSVISVSWGSFEQSWTPAARDAMQAALADAVRLQVGVVFASGDELATGGVPDGKAHVWFPASSPYALSCGGTRMQLDAVPRLVSEAVWNEGTVGTGGGISDLYPVPFYQSGVALPPSVNDGQRRRGVPDVAAAAAGIPGYRVVLGGKDTNMDGTSAATPLWAGLLALCNAARGGRAGFPNAALYSNPAAFHPVLQGDNRNGGIGYSAGAGWNACTGLGSPIGPAILRALVDPAIV